MKILLIVYHTRTSGTEQMVRATAEGALSETLVETRLVWCADATAEDVRMADGVIFACPENLAAMSGLMKEFFDRTYYDVLDRVQGRPYAVMVCGGSDGQGAVRQITRIATGWRLKAIADPIVVITHAQTPQAIAAPKTIGGADLDRCRELGSAFAAGLAMGVY
ncbi:MAG TPA: NAD(P)H-dependent oxidoreductase [Caulobacteraceae bacterium]|nr:NAD(P)H-dependent oxidoreductase [Caulobacteraceae bacterium]